MECRWCACLCADARKTFAFGFELELLALAPGAGGARFADEAVCASASARENINCVLIIQTRVLIEAGYCTYA